MMIVKSNFQADLLVGVARGGWVPTRLLSDELGVKFLASIGVTYSNAERTDLITYSVPEPIKDGTRILLIEDILESGNSVQYARRHFESRGADVRTAAFYFTERTLVRPDYSLGCVPDVPILPWER